MARRAVTAWWKDDNEMPFVHPDRRLVAIARKRPSRDNHREYILGTNRYKRRKNSNVINFRTGGFMGPEKKFNNFQKTSTALTEGWAEYDPTTFDSVSGVAQGTAQNQRNGRYYFIHSLQLKGFVFTASLIDITSPVGNEECRIIVFIDKQTNGAQANAEDVMDASQSADIHAFRNLEFTQRFQVLYDKQIKVNRLPIVDQDAQLWSVPQTLQKWGYFHKFKKPLKVMTCGTGSTITDMTTASIHVIAVATDSTIFIEYQARIRFTG